MPKIFPFKNNFTSGEISPKLRARVDLNQYKGGCETQENFLSYPHGGARFRPGFHYVNDAISAVKTSRLVPFVFSREQAYILEFGDEKIRVYKDNGIVVEDNTPEVLNPSFELEGTGVTTSSTTSSTTSTTTHSTVTSSTSHSSTTSSSSSSSTSSSTTTTSDTSTSSTSTSSTTTTTHPYAGGLWTHWVEEEGNGSIETETTDPYIGDQSAKITTGAGDNTKLWQARITCVAATNYYLTFWTKGDGTTAGEVAIYDVSNSGYITARSTTTRSDDIWKKVTMAFTTPGGCVELKIEFFAGPTDGDAAYFDQVAIEGKPYEIVSPYSHDELSQLQWTQSADYLYLAHPDYKPRTLTRSGHTNWTLASYAPTADPFGADASDDCPRTVTFHEERLCWAGTDNNPQTIWMSKSGDFDDYTTGVDADHAIVITIASDQVNVINWLAPSSALIVGTKGGEFKIRGGSDDIITPSSISAKSVSTVGSKEDTRAIRVNNVMLFPQTAARKMIELRYYFEEDAFIGQNLSLISEHVTISGIKEMAFQQEPDSTLWMCREDGVLVSLTYERHQSVFAWARHIIAGTDAEVESIAVIPNPAGDADELWAVCKLTVDGNTVRFIEYMDDDAYMDHFLYYSGATPTTQFGNLEHLEGEEVALVGDDALYPPETVVNGLVTLDDTATTMYSGLAYEGTLKTLRPEIELNNGHSYGLLKSLNKIVITVYESIGGNINGETLLLVDPEQPMGEAPIPFTGDLDITHIVWDRNGQVTITQDDPFPLIIQAISGSMFIAEEH